MNPLNLLLLVLLIVTPAGVVLADDNVFSATDMMGATIGDASQCIPEDSELSASRTIKSKVGSVICNILSCRIRLGELNQEVDLSNEGSKGPKKVFGVICPEDFDEFNLDLLKKTLPDKTVVVTGEMSESDGEIYIYIRSPLDINIVKKPKRPPHHHPM